MYWTEIGEMEKGALKEMRQKPAQNLTFPFLQPPLVVVLPPHVETRWGAWLGPLRGSFSEVGGWGALYRTNLNCSVPWWVCISQAYILPCNSLTSTVAAPPLTNIKAIFPSPEISPKYLLRKLFVWCPWRANRNSSGFSAVVNTEENLRETGRGIPHSKFHCWMLSGKQNDSEQ